MNCVNVGGVTEWLQAEQVKDALNIEETHRRRARETAWFDSKQLYNKTYQYEDLARQLKKLIKFGSAEIRSY